MPTAHHRPFEKLHCRHRAAGRQFLSAHKVVRSCGVPPRRRCRKSTGLDLGESLVGRYYDPATGQFLSVDPLVGLTGQAYAYAGADPVNESDPTGLSAPSNPACSGSGPIGASQAQLKQLCGAQQQNSQKVAAAELANQGTPCGFSSGLLGAIGSAFGAAGSFIWQHRTGELQIVGVVAAVASVATGVGAIAGISELGLVSGGFGVVSGLTDVPACIGGNGLSCVGATTGIVGGVGGLAGAGISTLISRGLIISSTGSEFTAGIAGSVGFAVGAGGAAFDLLVDTAG